MLNQITPVILTYNEEANIARVLDALEWAKDIVVVDSYSTDETLSIIKNYPNVALFQRKFDRHTNQWNFAIVETDIKTDWVLALDADYVLTKKFIEEISALESSTVQAYTATFRYCVFGKPLRGALYPPVTVLYQRENAHYTQDGHTQRINVPGLTSDLNEKILHDDRKPLLSWLRAQDRYMELEADAIHGAAFGAIGFNDRIRKLVFPAPPLTFFYCLVFKLGILDGWAGFYYATQRTVAELILSLKLIERIFFKYAGK